MSQEQKISKRRWTATFVERFVTILLFLVPILLVSILILDSSGRLLEKIFNIENENQKALIYLRILIGIIAVLSTALLVQRYVHLEKIRIGVENLSDQVLKNTFPQTSISSYFDSDPNMDSLIRQAKHDVILIGINLTSLLGSVRHSLQAHLAAGRKVTVALIDPTKGNLEAVTARSDVARTSDYYKSKLDTSLRELREMASFAERSGSIGRNLSLFRLPYVPTYSIRAFDMQDGGGKIIIEIYPLKTADRPPMFLLTPDADRYWFSYFEKQMRTMLRDGRHEPLSPTDTRTAGVIVPTKRV